MASAAASFMVGRRVVENSRKNYRGKLNSIKMFFLENQERVQYLDDLSNIIVPLPAVVIEEMFGWISTNTNLAKPGRSAPRKVHDHDHDLEAGSVHVESEVWFFTMEIFW
jgi:hypothetical protein